MNESKADKPFKLPAKAILELTYNCSHKCRFCSCPWEHPAKDGSFHFDKREELSAYEWKKVLIRLKRYGVERIGLSGGEPLLKDSFFEILRIVRKSGLCEGQKITVITNGSEMSDEHIEIFRETGVHLSFSLPGLETFAYHTMSDTNTPENVLRWLRRAHNAGISTTVNVTVTKKNIHELYQIIGNALLAGADSLLLNRFMAGGRGMEYIDDLSLTKEQIVQMLDIAEQVLEDGGGGGYLGIEVPLCILDDVNKYKRLHIGSSCAAAVNFFAVDPSGYIRVCNHSPRRVGYVLSGELITDDGYWNMYAQKEYKLPGMCDGCGYIGHCSCGCREAAIICSGLPDTPDPCIH